MILEQAVLDVVPGQEAQFEQAFGQAKPVIAAADGFCSLRLSHCLEQENRYLLLVEWETLEDHLVGFRESEAFVEWRRLLQHFYDAAPTVLHYSEVASA
jgi:heme-degrading monooxygenase HmoA